LRGNNHSTIPILEMDKRLERGQDAEFMKIGRLNNKVKMKYTNKDTVKFRDKKGA